MAEKHYVNRIDHRTRIRVHLTYVRGRVRSFLIKLEHIPGNYWNDDWIEIARFDHNPDGGGHDVTEEGLHVDVGLHTGKEVTYWYDDFEHSRDLDEIINYCTSLFETRSTDFIGIYDGSVDPEQFDPPASP